MTKVTAEEILKIISELEIEELKGIEMEGDIELELESEVLIRQMAPQVPETFGMELSSAMQHLSNALKMIGK
ncbi:MAG: hypothetical protein QXL78_03155 [Methanocellales archaeon]